MARPPNRRPRREAQSGAVDFLHNDLNDELIPSPTCADNNTSSLAWANDPPPANGDANVRALTDAI